MSGRLDERLSENAALCEGALSELYRLNDPDTDRVKEAELYSLRAGGKRIRPFLVLEFCRLFGGDTAAALPYACGIEMMHTFSLIHDDLPCMDDDDMRRGRPTSHRVYGEATALLAGDSLELRAIETLLQNGHMPKERNAEAALLLIRAAGSEGMIGGQMIDMRGESEALSFAELLKLQKKKTGALIEAACLLGVLAAGRPLDGREADAVRRYAGGIGLAFQITDDILDVEGDAALLGKSTGVDAERGKTTFLSFMSIDDARAYARRVTDEGIAAIADIKGSELLCELAEQMLVRGK